MNLISLDCLNSFQNLFYWWQINLLVLNYTYVILKRAWWIFHFAGIFRIWLTNIFTFVVLRFRIESGMTRLILTLFNYHFVRYWNEFSTGVNWWVVIRLSFAVIARNVMTKQSRWIFFFWIASLRSQWHEGSLLLTLWYPVSSEYFYSLLTNTLLFVQRFAL